MKLFIFLFFIFIQSATYGKDFYKFNYSIEEGDTFSRILKRFAKINASIRSNDPGVLKTQTVNKKIKNWKSLPNGNTITLYILKEKGNLDAINAYLLKNTKKISKEKKEQDNKLKGKNELSEEKKDKVKVAKKKTTKKNKTKKNIVRRLTEKRKNLLVYYSYSTGSFSDLLPGLLSIDYSQTTPLTIGMLGKYRFKNSRQMIDFSVSGSFLNKGEFTGASTDKLSIPPEIGLSSHYRYISKYKVHPFVGIDIEKFSTFNLPKFNSSSVLDTESHMLGFLVVGAQFKISLWKYPVNLKATYGNDIFHNSENLSYTGSRIAVFASLQLHRRISYNLHYKKHQLTGSTELDIDRYGVGISYHFY